MNRELLEKLASLERRIGALERQERAVPVVAIYTTAAGQSIPNNSSTVVNFGTMVVDTHSAVTTGSGWHFTAPLAGAYLVAAHISMAATTAWAENEPLRLQVARNGTLARVLGEVTGNDFSGSAQIASVGGSGHVSLAAGDTLDVQVLQVSGDTLALATNALRCWISIARVN